jgi:hypothetical protein
VELPNFQPKEVVELIEQKIPFGIGKILVPVALVLAIAALIIFTFRYVWSSALSPFVRIIVQLVSGTTFTLHITLGSILSLIFSILVYGFLFLALNLYARRLTKMSGECVQTETECVDLAKKCVEKSAEAVEIAREVVRRQSELGVRVEALERRST